MSRIILLYQRGALDFEFYYPADQPNNSNIISRKTKMLRYDSLNCNFEPSENICLLNEVENKKFIHKISRVYYVGLIGQV